VSAFQRQKWKRSVNEYKFIREELKITKAICSEAGSLFEEHYRAFLARHNIDLAKLNQDNAKKIKEAYNIQDEPAGAVPMVSSDCTDLVASTQPVEKTEQVEMSEDDIALHNVFSKLFKSIAIKIHPDKIDPLKHDYHQRRKMEKDFIRANSALENRAYFTLIEIADELDIPLPKNYNQQTRWMKRQTQEVRAEVETQRSTYNYVFAQAETDEQKDNIVRQFVQQLFGLNL
jgi:hypothetical protein